MEKLGYIDVNVVAEKGKNSLFHRAYYLINVLTPKEKVILGSSKEKVCRFCGKNSKMTSFKKKAHIIPEFMGNKYAFSNYECDICNEYFGRLEDSLSNFAGIINSLSTIKGKKGYPKFKGNKEDLEVFAKNDKSVIVRSTNVNQSESFIYDKKKQRIFIDVNQPGYIPLDVYKSLVKIGLCLLDEKKILNYTKTISWLKETNKLNPEFDFFFTVFRKIGGEKRFLEPLAFLYEKRNSNQLKNFPHHILIIVYGIIQYQIFLPFNENDNHLSKEKEIFFPIEEHLIIDEFENGIHSRIVIDQVILKGIEKIVGERNRFSFGFKEFE